MQVNDLCGILLCVEFLLESAVDESSESFGKWITHTFHDCLFEEEWVVSDVLSNSVGIFDKFDKCGVGQMLSNLLDEGSNKLTIYN